MLECKKYYQLNSAKIVYGGGRTRNSQLRRLMDYPFSYTDNLLRCCFFK